MCTSVHTLSTDLANMYVNSMYCGTHGAILCTMNLKSVACITGANTLRNFFTSCAHPKKIFFTHSALQTSWNLVRFDFFLLLNFLTISLDAALWNAVFNIYFLYSWASFFKPNQSIHVWEAVTVNMITFPTEYERQTFSIRLQLVVI